MEKEKKIHEAIKKKRDLEKQLQDLQKEIQGLKQNDLPQEQDSYDYANGRK